MQDYSSILELYKGLLILLPILAGIRAVYCIIKMVQDDEQRPLYKRRLKNVVIFTCVAMGILDFLMLIYKSYFS